MDNIDEEYDRLAERLHSCTKNAETDAQRGAARDAENQERTSELVRLCREAIKEDLKEKRAEVLAEATRGGKKHPLCPSRLCQSQDEDDCSPQPKGNSHWVEKGM
ncbi:hypothetical protein RB195_018026 [Necator americanus]|uniref:Uncharacterized protein n=1 Tax=Necator americanus TaxID=51031 RepID=A0ABR1C7U3_NECAM